MNEPSKHAVWVLGLAGSITLVQWNTIVGIACGAAGFIAACLSIYSWFEKRRRHQRDAGPNQKDAQHGRKHHRRTLIVFLVLVAALLIAAIVKAKGSQDGTTGNNGTYGTTGLETAANTSSALRNAWAATVAEDARKLVYDVLSGFSWAGFVQAIFVAYLGAKGLRNHTRLGNMKVIGDLLRWINLEAGDGYSPQPSSGLRPPSPATAGERQISEQTNKTQ